MWNLSFVGKCESWWLWCPAGVRACCDTAPTCWSSWKRCCSCRLFWVELLSRNNCLTWSCSLTTQTTLWVLNYTALNCTECLKCLNSKPFFISCTVCSFSHCCHWDPVQQGADLLISAPHSCSVHWCKVGVTVEDLQAPPSNVNTAPFDVFSVGCEPELSSNHLQLEEGHWNITAHHFTITAKL